MARSPVLPRFAESLGAAPELIGIIVAASTVTGVLFKLPAGALSDLLGRRRVMLLGAVFFAVPPFIYPIVEDAGALLVLRFVHGFATAIFAPVASAYVAGLGEAARGARLGWFSSANDLGATAGPLIGGLILYATTGFAASYLLVGVLGVLALGMALLVPETATKTTQAESSLTARAAEFRDGLRDVITTPAVLAAAAVEATMYLGFGAFLGFLPLYARTVGLNDGAIAVVLAVQLTIALLAKPLTGNLSDQDASENRPGRFADVPDRAEHPHPGPEAPDRDQIGDQRIGRRSDRGNPETEQRHDRDEAGKACHPENQRQRGSGYEQAQYDHRLAPQPIG